MKTSALVAIAFGLVSASANAAMAQRLPPLPSPPVSLTVPHPIPPAPSSPPRDLYQASPPRDLYQQLTPPRPVHLPVYRPGIIHGYGGYGALYYSEGYSPFAETYQPERLVARGWLRLESSPGSAQVFVDNYYAGVIDDFGISGRALELDAGPHRIEVREAGFQTLSFEVRIGPNETTRFRGDLQRLATVTTPPPAMASVAPPTAAAPKATYIIPNCYAGDRPPTHPLPQGCEAARLVVRKP